MEETRAELEHLVDEVHKLEHGIGEVEQKLESLVQQLVDEKVKMRNTIVAHIHRVPWVHGSKKTFVIK